MIAAIEGLDGSCKNSILRLCWSIDLHATWGITMRAIIILGACAAVAACAFQRAETASRAQASMIGMPAEQVLACMGVPSGRQQLGSTEVWAYQSGGDSVSSGSGYGQSIGGGGAIGFGSSNTKNKYCVVNVVMKNDVVSQVNYSGRTGGLLTGDEQCAFAVNNCVR